MKHTFLVTPQALHHFADTGEETRGAVPELIFRLLATSVTDATDRRIPFGRDVNQPGVDGFLETQSGFREFVPSGKSFWEIGTGKDPRAKANADYKARTDSKDVANKNEFTLVLVTPRTHSEGWTDAEQKAWIAEKRKEGPWKDVRVIDGSQICQWLAFFPSIDAWLAERMRLVRDAVTSPATHWENILARSEPHLTPAIFTIGRDPAKTELLKVLNGELRELRLQTLRPREAVDFIVAILASLSPAEDAALSGRCVLVGSSIAWNDLCELPDSHVLIPYGALDIADQGSDLLTLALRKGHRVIFPTPRSSSGEHISIPLYNPKKFELKTELKNAGFTELKSQQLAEQAGGSPSKLLLVLSGMPETPPWAKGDDALFLAPAMLAGSWDDHSEEEKKVLTALFDRDYQKWASSAPVLCVTNDPPLQNRESLWRFTSIFEAWHLLGGLLSSNDLTRLEDAARQVLGERNPAFELPKEERWMSSIKGKERKYSRKLREGIAEALALLATHPEPLTRLAGGVAKRTADNVVRSLLEDADWIMWASLSDVLPLLAEASPTSFLKAVRRALDAKPSPVATLFSQESSGITGWNYATGLWWALETLAWSEEFLSESATLLCRCSEIDPGGNWANRPSNSLASIFLPWHPQTSASIEKRTEVISTLAEHYPDVGWKLLIALLPRTHSFTSGTRKPQWGDLISSGWQDQTSIRDYRLQVTNYTDIAIKMAQADPKRLGELIGHILELPATSREQLLSHLRSDTVQGLDDAARLPLWNALLDLAGKHRKFHDAAWAMPETEVAKIESAAKAIEPKEAFIRYQRLFSGRDFDLYEEKGNYEEQREALEKKRADAVGDLLASGGIQLVLNFARAVPSARNVGVALARHGSVDLDAHILPRLLTGDRDALDQLAQSYVFGRFLRERYNWIDTVDTNSWTQKQKALFFSILPFNPNTWMRAEKALVDVVSEYWNIAQPNSWDAPEHMVEAAEKLLQRNRPAAALSCLEGLIQQKKRLPTELTFKVLDALTRSEEPNNQLDAYHITEVIQALQDDPTADRNALIKVELNYLSLLDLHSGAAPKTLERELASSPVFFCEIIKTLFRSENEPAQKEPTARDTELATAAYKLLEVWRTIPGSRDDGSVDADALRNWIIEVKKITAASGRLRVALLQIGQVFAYHGQDPGGFWLPLPIAEILDEAEHEKMRNGFVMEKRNQRGVFTWTAGKEEREYAAQYKLQAKAAEKKGFRLLAEAMNDLASAYEQDAEREAANDPYAD